MPYLYIYVNETKTVTAARGNILDRYGRILVSNKECYNIKIDITKLFSSEDPNSVILELVDMVRGYGDDYTDDLPITNEPPFEYDPNMTEIQRTMLEAYFKDKDAVIRNIEEILFGEQGKINRDINGMELIKK